MAKLGSQTNPLILNVHDEEMLNYVSQICNQRGWHFICGINPQDLENLTDLNKKLYPPTLERNLPKVGRNEPCPCGSGAKYKKCHWDPILDAYS